jgi:hypothetical protein
MHLDEEQIQRLLHGEVAPPGAASVHDHLDRCPECRLRLTESEREEAWVFDRLRRLDHARPERTAEAILGSRRRPASSWGRMAAGIILTLAAAGAAYAAPGSPLPRLIDHLVELVRRTPETPVKSVPLPSTERSQAGIAVAPGDRMTIDFLGDQSGNTTAVSLTDSLEVMVRAQGGTTTFTSDNQRLAIGHHGPPATFEILVPRSAPWVEIRAGGRRVWLKESGRIRTDIPRDSGGRYRTTP